MMTPFLWPEKEDYDIAMDALQEKVRDPAIRRGTIQKDQTGTLHYGGANLYVTLYRVDDWMIRCFCRNDLQHQQPPDDILTRYEHISRFCSAHAPRITSLVPITYVSDAIEVDYYNKEDATYVLEKTEVLPFVKMPFLQGMSLGSFIARYYQQQAMMAKLSTAWLKMIYELESIEMAHGDLDLTNVFVVEHTPEVILKLIDYDNAWVPTLGTSRQQTEIGHEHFQHPAFQSRRSRPYDKQMDRFSALTIYISLLALMQMPSLYQDAEWGVDDSHHLLLTRADYEAQQSSFVGSTRIAFLRQASLPGLAPLLAELCHSLKENVLPRSLQELVPQAIVQLDFARPGSVSPETLPDAVPVAMNDETEAIRWEWDAAKPVAEPLAVPDPATPDGTTEAVRWMAPSLPQIAAAGATTEAALPTTIPAQPIYQPVTWNTAPPSVSRPAYRPSAKGTGWWLVLLVVVLLVIVVALLWYFHVIPLPFLGQPTHHALTLSAAGSIRLEDGPEWRGCS